MIAKPGGSCWKNNPPQTVWLQDSQKSPHQKTVAQMRGCLEFGSWHPHVSFWGVDQFVRPQLRTPPKKLPHDLIGTNKQTNMTQVVDVFPMKQQLVSWTMDLPVSEIPKRIPRVLSCAPNLAFGLFCSTRPLEYQWKTWGIHMESPHGELLIDRLCSAFPSEWNMLYIFVYRIDFVEFCLCSAFFHCACNNFLKQKNIQIKMWSS